MNFRLPVQWDRWLSQYGLSDHQERWLLAAGIFLVTLFTVYLVRSVVAWRVTKLAERTTTVWDDAAVDALRQTRLWFVLALAVFCASLAVIPNERREIAQTAMILILLLQLGLWGHVLVGSAAERLVERRGAQDPAAAMTVSALAMIGKLVLFVLLLLLALDNMGIEVTALIAGLGVGGIAVALAVQNILGDLLASLSIVFDKPFVPGDFVIVGDQMGTVRHIGMKTTRLESLSGEQLIFPNNDLLQSRIRNFKRMRERRVVFAVGVTYDTPRVLLREIPKVLRESVEIQSDVRFDRAHFKDFGDFSLNYEIVYFVLSSDFMLYMDAQQAINLAIHERFEQLDVEFAYPTQTLYVQKTGDPPAERAPQD